MAFKSLSIPYGWAKYPMIHRVKEIDHNIPMTVLFGSRSWMDTNSGYTIKYLRERSYVDVQIIKGAGHHVYADRPTEFNNSVNLVCDKVESDCDIKQDGSIPQQDIHTEFYNNDISEDFNDDSS